MELQVSGCAGGGRWAEISPKGRKQPTAVGSL